MVEDEKLLVGSHGRMSDPSKQMVVGGKRMSKPFVPYGMKRYRIKNRICSKHSISV